MSRNDDRDILYRCVQKVATGPGYSKSLSFEDMRDAVLTILGGDADPVRAAVFFIGLRMKRESMEENKGALDALMRTASRVTADVDHVIDIAEPYDGYLRGLSVSAFLAPLLAEMGEPAFSHGVESVGPKYGLTHHKVWRALGIDTGLSVADAAARLANPDIGWAYLDMPQINPSLFALNDLRERMIKRGVLTTVEVLMKPISGRQSTHFITGYVHSAYPPVYTELARFSGFESAMIVRGVEGGITPSLQQSGKYHVYHDGAEAKQADTDPAKIGIQADKRAIPLPAAVVSKDAAGEKQVDVDAAARHAAKLGVAALRGEPGMAADSLRYLAAMVLCERGRFDTLEAAAKAVGKVLDSGAVLPRLEAAGAAL